MLTNKDRVFGHGTTTVMLGNRDHFGQKMMKNKGKGNTKVDQKETEERSLVKNKRRNQKCGQKMVFMVQRKTMKERLQPFKR